MKVTCVGVGLIGASIAARIHEVRTQDSLVACDTTYPALPFVRCHQPDDWQAAVADADIVIVALPPALLLQRIAAIIDAAPKTAVVTDVCSVKNSIHQAAAKATQVARFVGGHPMMGSEKRGAANANSGWLLGAPMALTSTPVTAADALQTARTFFASLGCVVHAMTPEAHDVEVARTSHVPQLVATALAQLVPEQAALVGPALRDMTRIAESPYELWSEVLALNHNAVDEALGGLIASLQTLRDPSARAAQFAQAKARRQRFPRAEQGKLSDRVRESATGSFAVRVAEHRRQGKEVFAFNVGEPAMPLDPAFRALVDAAAVHASIQYTATAGTELLRQQVATIASDVMRTNVTSDQVLVTTGAKQAIHLALASLLSPGDEVLLPTPAWVSFAELIRLAGGVPVAVDHSLSDESLERHYSPRTRAVLLNSPNNPTGGVYSAAQMQTLRAFAQRHDLWLLSDELYRCFSFDGPHESILRGYNKDRAVWFDGISKSHALTGVRMGWAVMPATLGQRMRALASQETSCPSSIAQHIAERALETHPRGLPSLISATSQRRTWLMHWADDVSQKLSHNLWPARGSGAFYGWFDVTPFATSAIEFCDALLDNTGVALMHGDAFGAPGYVRLAYATPEHLLQAGCARIADFCSLRLQRPKL